jgi:hypothetical protein
MLIGQGAGASSAKDRTPQRTWAAVGPLVFAVTLRWWLWWGGTRGAEMVNAFALRVSIVELALSLRSDIRARPRHAEVFTLLLFDFVIRPPARCSTRRRSRPPGCLRWPRCGPEGHVGAGSAGVAPWAAEGGRAVLKPASSWWRTPCGGGGTDGWSSSKNAGALDLRCSDVLMLARTAMTTGAAVSSLIGPSSSTEPPTWTSR